MERQKLTLVSSAMPFIFLLFTGNSKENEIDLSLLQNEPQVKQETIEDPLYEECINHLKEYESFSDSIYIDNDGSRTIGYGHHIMKGEKFKKKISEKRADRILRRDFNKKIKWVKKQYGLDNSKSYALALFCYNIGETKLYKSTLNDLVKEGKPIDNEIVKWKWFKYKGKWKENRRLKQRRKFELYIFKKV